MDAHGALSVCNLAMQVVELHSIMVSNAQPANTCCCQVHSYRTAQAARSNDEDRGVAKA